ncbi:MAG: peptidylprolyl isomerase [Desulfuromonadaceae bacterium]
MVRCFEELQRGGDAQRKLKQLTDLEAEEEEGTGPLVAQIGDRRITRDQLERELNQMPENQRRLFDDPSKRRQYLQSKLFEELLYDMALRKEYQKDREIRRQLRSVEKMLLAQKVLREEVNDKVQVSDGDIELYYKANLDEFKVPLTAKIAHIFTSSQEKAQEAKNALNEGMAFEQAVQQFSEDNASKSNHGEIGTITQGSQYIPTVGQAPEMVEQLLALDAQAVSEPIQSEKGYHVFKILEKTPERIQSLEEVKPRVQAMVGRRKAAELQDALLQRLLKAEKVKIFDQSLVEPAADGDPGGQEKLPTPSEK